MLAAQLSITLSIHAEEYQSRRIEVCLFTRPDNRAAAIDARERRLSARGKGNRSINIANADLHDYDVRLA